MNFDETNPASKDGPFHFERFSKHFQGFVFKLTQLIFQRGHPFITSSQNCQFQKGSPSPDDVITHFPLGKKSSTRDKSLNKTLSLPDDVLMVASSLKTFKKHLHVFSSFIKCTLPISELNPLHSPLIIIMFRFYIYVFVVL